MLLQQLRTPPKPVRVPQQAHKRMTSVSASELHDQARGNAQRPRDGSASPPEFLSLLSPSEIGASGSRDVAATVGTQAAAAAPVAHTEIAPRLPAKHGDVTVRLATLADDAEVSTFLMSLDEASYEMRFGELERIELKNFLKPGEYIATFIATKLGKIVGMTDCSVDPEYDPETVCSVNIVVGGEWQGKGVGKALITETDNWLKDAGYRHKIERLFPENEEHIQRLRGLGRQEIPADPDEIFMNELVEFWTALDPQRV